MTEITERLHLERDALIATDADEGLLGVQQIARRRRRRTSMVGVAAAGGLLVAGVGAARLINSDTTEVVVTDTAPMVTTESDTPAASTAVTTTIPATSDVTTTNAPGPIGPSVSEVVRGRNVESDLTQVTDGFRTAAGDDVSATWHVAWNDGFLVGGWSSTTEATTAYFSPDGESWEAVPWDVPEVDFTGGSDDRVLVADGRLVMLGARWEADSPQPVVVSTTDLVNWAVEDIPVEPPPADLPAAVQAFINPRTMSVNADGWIVTIDQELFLNTRDLVAQRTGRTVDNMSEARSDDGILVTIDPDGAEPEDVWLPWADIEAEIGVELTEIVRSGIPAEVWTGTWNGEAPQQMQDLDDSPLPYSGEPLVATDNAFVTITRTTQFPDDGPPIDSTRLFATIEQGGWSELAVPIPERVEFVFPLNGDLGVVAEAGDLSVSIYRVDIETDVWTPIDVPGLPETASYVEAFRGAAFTLDASPDDDVEARPSTTTFEQNGFGLVWIYDNYISSYEVTSLATGDIVVAESIDIRDVEGLFEFAFEHLVGGLNRATTITDPVTGDVLMEITVEELTAANPPETYFGPEPEPWIVATGNGTSWFVGEVPPRISDSDLFHQESMTVSGGRLLYWSDSREWFVVDLD